MFVTYDGQVKLVDFGVAKTLAAAHQTRPGAIKGKLAYMAPEQLQRTVVDRRADVFAVGVMLWEMLAGRRMWHGMTEVEIVAHLASNQPLPPLPADGSVPAGLESICTRALELDPDRRHQTAAELELELEGTLAGTADSHARDLGKVVSLAFDVERADRQAFIERCVRQRESAAERAIIDSKTTLESALPDIDVTLSNLDHDASPAPRDAILLPRVVWLRRAAAVAALAAVASVIALVDGGRAGVRFPSEAGTRSATAAPPRDTPELAIARAPGPVAGSAPRAEPLRARRRHRATALDEDATLPPSTTDVDQRHDREIAAPDGDPQH